MRILTDAEPLGDPPGPVSLAIGVFDGVHLGHAAVIRQTLMDARQVHGSAVAVTFDRHPSAVVAPERTPLMVCPLWHRLEILAGLGLDAALVFHFDTTFSRQPAGTFLQRLLTGFRSVTSVCVGTGFVFGHRRGGNITLLQAMGKEHGFAVHGVAPLQLEHEVISSTRVRELIAEGDFARATRFLGRPYALAGEVRAGDGLGRQLGFPTANLEVPGLVLPPNGVYAALARGPGWIRPAAVNIGRRPTVDSVAAAVRVEAHLLGFEGDLYDQRLELELDHRLRDETRFESREALVNQIAQDILRVEAWGNRRLP